MTPELTPQKPPTSEILVVTGMSGAGRTTAAHALEDHGWYVVENMPPQLFGTLADLVTRSPDAFGHLALVMDVRSKSVFDLMRESLAQLRAGGIEYRVLFLDAADELLVRRFEAGRRPHPLQGSGRIADGIAAERELLRELKERAHVVLDTTEMNVHMLATSIAELFTEDGPAAIRLNVMSFGFKYGLPSDANYVADVRFIPNPHWVPELRPHTGLDEPVAQYVLTQDGVEEFIGRYQEMLVPVLNGYRQENKHYATVAVGCTGGKHRSVAVAEELGRRLAQLPHVSVNLQHRDLGRE